MQESHSRSTYCPINCLAVKWMVTRGLWIVGFSYLALSLAVLWKWHQLLGGVALDRWAGCCTHGSALLPSLINHNHSHSGVPDTWACYLSMGRGLVYVSADSGPDCFGWGDTGSLSTGLGSAPKSACHVICTPCSCPTVGTPFCTESEPLSPTMHTVSHRHTHHPKPLHNPPRCCAHTQLGWLNRMMK